MLGSLQIYCNSHWFLQSKQTHRLLLALVHDGIMFQFPQPLWKRLRSWSNIFNQKMESPFARNHNLAGWVPAVGIPRDLSMVTGLVSHFSYMLKRSCNKTERGMSHCCQALTIFVPKTRGNWVYSNSTYLAVQHQLELWAWRNTRLLGSPSENLCQKSQK